MLRPLPAKHESNGRLRSKRQRRLRKLHRFASARRCLHDSERPPGHLLRSPPQHSRHHIKRRRAPAPLVGAFRDGFGYSTCRARRKTARHQKHGMRIACLHIYGARLVCGEWLPRRWAFKDNMPVGAADPGARHGNQGPPGAGMARQGRRLSRHAQPVLVPLDGGVPFFEIHIRGNYSVLEY